MTILGLDHETPQNSACGSQTSFVMSTGGNDMSFLRGFSSCSINIMKDNFIKKNLYTCTSNPVSMPTDFLKLTSLKPGQIYDGSEQCRQLFGADYKMMYD